MSEHTIEKIRLMSQNVYAQVYFFNIQLFFKIIYSDLKLRHEKLLLKYVSFQEKSICLFFFKTMGFVITSPCFLVEMQCNHLPDVELTERVRKIICKLTEGLTFIFCEYSREKKGGSKTP